MTRFITLICAAMAAISGFFLYTKKHETLVLDQGIRKTIEDTRRVQQQTAMLRTEWALLNQPDRLSALAKRVLPDLQQVQPTQFVQLANLQEHLPAINHNIIRMSPPKEQAQRHLAAIAVPSLASAVASTRRDNMAAAETHTSHPRTRSSAQNTRSLEQSLALLSGQETSYTPRHKRHSSASLAERKASHNLPARSANTEEDVVWHPVSHTERRHSHITEARASAAMDSQAPLPPPVPLTD